MRVRVRYLSSDNTAKKFKLGPHLAYVASLPSPSLPSRKRGPQGEPPPKARRADRTI